jgi:uncharacterized protein YndB with AHSA1/START domain
MYDYGMATDEANGRRVERETILEAEPERVWEALTDEGLLSDWFADGARLDPWEGGEVEFECDDGERSGTVRSIEEERELAFTWSRDGEGESLVTFTIEPVEYGTRLIVVERALDSPVAISAWGPRLRSLAACLASLVLA